MGREHVFDGSPGSLGSDPFDMTGVMEATAKAAAIDPALESDGALMAAAVAMELARESLEAAQARVLGRLAATGATDAEVGMRTGSWLAWEADVAAKKARSRVVVAEHLGWFDVFCEALGNGRVRFRHAEVLASVANRRNRDALRELQDTIVEWAAQYEFKQWATLVRQLAADLDQDGSFDPDEDQKRARLRLRDNLDGTVELKGLLGGATAVTVTQGLESIADELFRRYSADREQDPDLPLPSRARLMAEALGEAVRRARAVDLDSTRQPAVEALIVIEEGEDGGAAVSDLSGRQVPGSIAEALLVDPRLRAMTTDVGGNPLWLGRTTRLATRAQRLALAARDGGCIFPGCDAPPDWCDVHHQPGWKPDGRTDIDTMFLGCRHHHGVTHRKGWTCIEDPERPQQWIWITPGGRRLHSQRQRRRPG